MSASNIQIQPWPEYPADGGAPSWVVTVESKGKHLSLSWSTKLMRFSKGWNTMHLQRSNPTVYAECVRLMQELCGTKQSSDGTENGVGGTKQGGTLSRAHETPRGFCPICPMGHSEVRDGTVAAGQGQTSASLRIRPSPTDAVAVDLHQAHKARLSRDPRFALWAAADTAGPDPGPLADPVYPDVQRRLAEKNELRRVAAVSALRNGGKHLTPQERAENRVWAGLAPLAGHLGSGEP